LPLRDHVLVVGACGVDLKGIPYAPLQPKTSNPGIIQRSFGGVGRNIAENLARLGMTVVLLSVVGDDPAAESLLNHAQATGISTAFVKRLAGQRTGSYLALADPEGDLALAISDYEIVQLLDKDYLKEQARLFSGARMIVLDLNLTESALECVFELAGSVPIFVDPTSNAKALKLRPYLRQVWGMAPNAAEAAALSTIEINNSDEALLAARYFVQEGMQVVVITLGAQGAVFADASGNSGYVPALPLKIVEATGAGDSLSAGVVFGLLNGLATADALGLGMAAAALTLQSSASVYPDLQPKALVQ